MAELKIEKMLPREVSLRNPNHYVIEGWIFAETRLTKLTIQIGEQIFSARYSEILRTDIGKRYSKLKKRWSLFSGFLVPIFLKPVSGAQEFHVLLRAEFGRHEVLERDLGELLLSPWEPHPLKVAIPQNVDVEQLVVIAMATYKPDHGRFERQIESIRNQNYPHWICIVCDDASSPEHLQIIKSILGDDRRFFLIENQRRQGAYRNFERCLERIPAQAKYVALSDQDDFWYPNKLTRTLAGLTGSAQLAYCDMHIVGPEGELISETYWRNRKNYYRKTDLDLLALANTISGAGMVFKTSLLENALPFPDTAGDVFHDKWLAIVAAGTGGISYVDAPLYDYVQHSRNEIGFCDFGRTSVFQIFKETLTYQKYCKAVRQTSFRKRLDAFLEMLGGVASELSGFFHRYSKPIEAFADTASSRRMDTESVKLTSRVLSFFGLLKLTWKVRKNKVTTNNLEVRLMAGRVVNSVLKAVLPLAYRPIYRRFRRSQRSAGGFDLQEFQRKFSGRKFVLSDVKPRMNFIVSGLDPRHVWGGYIGVFNLARRFHSTGCSIRFLATDQEYIDPRELAQLQAHDSRLNEFLSKHVEYDACYSESQPIAISKDDIFVATSWWTAYIAHEAVTETRYAKFIFITQDFEPVFYEHGSYRALAEQSYQLDCYPLISTEILHKYFMAAKVFPPGRVGGCFNNPVLRFQLDSSQYLARKSPKKKLLFYGRPQVNNARNMYILGLLALNRARELGFFPASEWDIVGIGGNVEKQMLPSGMEINHIGKFRVEEYQNLVPQHDVGFALLDSPHPGLLPLEMAAAGLLVVTNTYNVKDAAYYAGISPNIMAVAPDYKLMAAALIEQSQKVENYEQRIAGSDIQWPHDWEEAIPTAAIEQAIRAIHESTRP